ncbi:MAG: hypothetical protein KF788_08770 [Piscinibacter sp.]|nr:hypothetical protein [Piscinibacter sp.]
MLTVTSDIDKALGFTARLHDQFPFAVAKGLTDTMVDVRKAMPARLEAELDEPTPYTKQGLYVTPARKDRLQAAVGFKDRQAEYLHYQVEGGTRPPKRRALRLPGEIELDRYGNMPAGLVRQLIARAKAGKRATGAQAKRFGVSKALDLFYGEPGDGRPAGLYKRVAIGTQRHQLVPLVVFPKRSARYRRRFDFYGDTQRIVDARLDANLTRAWQLALATAR